MSRRINVSQLQSRLRQLQAKRRQAIDQYNQAVRQHNQRVAQKLRDFNGAIARYNTEVRAYNNRLRTNQQRLRTEVARLQARPATSHLQLRESVMRVSASFERLERRSGSVQFSPQENFFTDLSEREAANTVSVFNTLAEDRGAQAADSGAEASDLQETKIEDELAAVAEEFDSRWRGALFALNPRNPEAARHFCTSVREIFTGVLELKAPDSAVFAVMPNCTRTERGNATRRSRITYLLSARGIDNAELADFAAEDVDNVVQLFDVLNSGTHGPSGGFGIESLRQIKRRVEDGLLFVCRLAI